MSTFKKTLYKQFSLKAAIKKTDVRVYDFSARTETHLNGFGPSFKSSTDAVTKSEIEM